MGKSSSSIERKVVSVPQLIIDNVTKIKIPVPIEHKFINGKYIPTEFKEGIKYIPNYKIIEIPKLITI